MVGAAEHGLVRGLVIRVAVVLVGVDVVCHHARHLRQQRLVAERVVQVTRLAVERVRIRRVRVEESVQVIHVALGQNTQRILHGVGVQVAHDQDVVVAVVGFVRAVIVQHRVCLHRAGVVGQL